MAWIPAGLTKLYPRSGAGRQWSPQSGPVKPISQWHDPSSSQSYSSSSQKAQAGGQSLVMGPGHPASRESLPLRSPTHFGGSPFVYVSKSGFCCARKTSPFRYCRHVVLSPREFVRSDVPRLLHEKLAPPLHSMSQSGPFHPNRQSQLPSSLNPPPVQVVTTSECCSPALMRSTSLLGRNASAGLAEMLSPSPSRGPTLGAYDSRASK
mmetsp:Transcript_2674/g.6815  ORF Transcript_2674/g.6815 Transcript_2674/m.6815 type:complete len:208 (-) Transcript_2674:755-1378(-)